MDTLRSRVIRLAHAKPSLRPHLLPLLMKTAGPPDLMFDALSEFGFIDDNEPSSEIDPRDSIGKELGGGPPRALSLEGYLRPNSSFPGIEPLIWFWDGKGWAVQTKARSESDALRLGQKLQKSLLPRTKVHYSDPYIHTLPLFVIYEGGQWVRLNPLEKKVVVKKGPTLTEQKDEIIREADSFFGYGSAKVQGSGGDYRLIIDPKDKKLKALYGKTMTSAETLEKLLQRIQEVIARARKEVAALSRA